MATDDLPSLSTTTPIRWPRVTYYLVTRAGPLGLLLWFLVTTGDHGFPFWFGLLLATMLAALIGLRLWLWCAALRRRH